MSSVTLGMTTKGINSTSRQMSAGVTMDCKLKDPVCGLHSPVFKVKGLTKAYNNYNFCTWRGRYYWVDEILFLTNDIQEVHCHLDPLATFKGAIDDTYAYVQYGDAGNWNKFIDDIRISPELEAPEWCDSQIFTLCPIFSETGTVVMRYMDCGNGGGVKTAFMTPTAYFGMLEDIYTLFNGMAIDEIYAYLAGCGSWRDNILSCVWVPYSLPTTGDSQIRLGGVICNVTCAHTTNLMWMINYDKGINIDWSVFNDHPFAKTSRWTSCQFYTPFGYCDIPIDLLRNQSKIYYKLSANGVTGDTAIKICERTSGDGYCYATFSGCLGVDLMGTLGTGVGIQQVVGNQFKNTAEIGLSLASMSLSAGNAFISGAKEINTMAGGVGTAEQAREYGLTKMKQNIASTGITEIAHGLNTGVGHTGFSGTIGGGAERLWLTSPIGQCLFIMKSFRPLLKSAYADFCNMYGYPVNYYLQLSSVTGYCKCCGAFIRNVPGATPADIATINSFLNSGIVLED